GVLLGDRRQVARSANDASRCGRIQPWGVVRTALQWRRAASWRPALASNSPWRPALAWSSLVALEARRQRHRRAGKKRVHGRVTHRRRLPERPRAEATFVPDAPLT